ncbi:hypothetical protein NDU88_004059 [Pleurodeles waltl]|uniref:Uncharacterized protein n=1 Tax=Pleurodeles waltl TaxID=8319 RepID=A0AAV7V0T4_PLEWA|nr:hypothetical protein NDU88_004059 [Pleurodeles waltl]
MNVAPPGAKTAWRASHLQGILGLLVLPRAKSRKTHSALRESGVANVAPPGARMMWLASRLQIILGLYSQDKLRLPNNTQMSRDWGATLRATLACCPAADRARHPSCDGTYVRPREPTPRYTVYPRHLLQATGSVQGGRGAHTHLRT